MSTYEYEQKWDQKCTEQHCDLKQNPLGKCIFPLSFNVIFQPFHSWSSLSLVIATNFVWSWCWRLHFFCCCCLLIHFLIQCSSLLVFAGFHSSFKWKPSFRFKIIGLNFNKIFLTFNFDLKFFQKWLNFEMMTKTTRLCM